MVARSASANPDFDASTTTQRVQSLDFMRGFAVVVMVMGHSIDAVLSPDARDTEAFRVYDALRGFTAPLFLFISGFAFAVVPDARWDAFVAFGRRPASG